MRLETSAALLQFPWNWKKTVAGKMATSIALAHCVDCRIQLTITRTEVLLPQRSRVLYLQK
jgi:hypothetical protein